MEKRNYESITHNSQIRCGTVTLLRQGTNLKKRLLKVRNEIMLSIFVSKTVREEAPGM